MNSAEVIETFRQTGALLEGHFLYASGRHGREFLQAARVLQFPEHTEKLCWAMADHFAGAEVGLVVGPATGGILLSYETARRLGCRAAFTEKDGSGGMILKRGFSLSPGTGVVVVDGVITRGGSVAKAIAHRRERGAEIAGVSVLIDRSSGEASFDCRYQPLACLSMESWVSKACPLCDKGVPLLDPDDIVLQ